MTPWQAHHERRTKWTTLARILSFGEDRGLIGTNPCEGGGRLYRAARTDKIWRDDDVARFLKHAQPQLALAMMLALWTGQRQGDLLRSVVRLRLQVHSAPAIQIRSQGRGAGRTAAAAIA